MQSRLSRSLRPFAGGRLRVTPLGVGMAALADMDYKIDAYHMPQNGQAKWLRRFKSLNASYVFFDKLCRVPKIN